MQSTQDMETSDRYKMPGEHGYGGILFPKHFPPEVLERIQYDFELRDEDIMLITYPKSGTTWSQEIVWLLVNEVDVATAKKVHLSERSPCLENAKPDEKSSIDKLEAAEGDRVIKSHLPFDYFSRQLKVKKTKVVVVVRNIKDLLVSYYHFYQMSNVFGNFGGSFNEFFELFKDKHLAFGDWFDHTLSYWNNRDHFNHFFLKYEDLQRDFNGTVKSLATFLGQNVTDEKLEVIAKHVSFREMKANHVFYQGISYDLSCDVSPFFRKGEVGDWRNYFTEEQNEYVDELYIRKIEAAGLKLDFEL